MLSATEELPIDVIVVTVPYQMAFGYSVVRGVANVLQHANVCYLGRVPFYQALGR